MTILQKETIRKQLFHLLLSLFFCVLVFLPWQLYILDRFPELANYVYDFNKRHITEALEGHDGDIDYYLGYLKDLAGNYLCYLIPIGILISFSTKEISARLNVGIVSGILFVFLFFSVVVQTKVDTYLFFIVPLVLMYIAWVLNFMIEKTGQNSIVKGTLAIALAYVCLNPIWIKSYLSPRNEERNIRIYNTKIYKELKNILPPGVVTVMNMNEFEDIDVMFYNKGITAYHFTMTEQDFEEIKARKLPIAVFKPHGKYKFPKYVEDYPYLHIIDQELRN